MSTTTNRMPETPPAVAALTGAARRSAEAAAEAAKAWFGHLQRLESALVAAVTMTDGEAVDATRLARAWDAWDALAAHKPDGLSPYWREHAGIAREGAKQHWWLKKLGVNNCHKTINDVMRDVSRGHRETLTRAGVPMPDGDCCAAAYWRDAAARGC